MTTLARGPWPLVWGAGALAVLNIATLLIAGRPWGITSAFALWGAKLAAFAGAEPVHWGYWQRPSTAQALDSGLEHDITSVMNLGIVLGALAAAALASRFAPALRIGGRSALAALIGGLLLGYGARLAYGCNIGAFFSGVASGSVHGWVWLVAALAGTLIGVRLRPLLGLANEAAPGGEHVAEKALIGLGGFAALALITRLVVRVRRRRRVTSSDAARDTPKPGS